MPQTEPVDAAAEQAKADALVARTTCTVRLADKLVEEFLVYWLELLEVNETGSGVVTNPETGEQFSLVWDPEVGYSGTRVA